MTGALPSTRSDDEAPAGTRVDRDGPVRTATAAGALLLASFVFRLPPLLNARSTNSDASVVGLQALHILRGERSPFLWGSGYQTSADSFVAAVFFWIGGPTPLALMLSALTLHVIATSLVFATLRRHVAPWTGLLLTMPLVVSPASVHTYALYPPRQLSITLAVASMWAIDGAARRGSQRDEGGRGPWLALGGALYGLAVSADPYPMVLGPVVVGYALLVSRAHLARRVPALGLGLMVGLVPFALLRQSASARSGPMGLSLATLAHNWDLLVRECLPWALGYKVYYAHHVMDYLPWDAPRPVRAVQIAGALAVAATVLFALVSAGRSSIPRSSRQLGVAGAMTYPVTIGAFLLSVMVMDHFSMRYLAALTLMLPFAALPSALVLGGKRLAALLAPHLVASALCGWIGYGPFVRGPIPVQETPELRDDYALFELLRERGIRYAEADYWAAYRLTFLFAERIVVVPTNASEDRYPPYRRAFEAASVFAYVFDPGRSREDLSRAEQTLMETNARVEKTSAGRLTVFVVTRR